MTREFDILNNFKGFGNPSGSFWFIGIEESLEIETDKLNKICSDYNRDYLAVNPNEIARDQERFGNSYTKVYDIMSKIIADEDWKTYRNKNLLQKNSDEFQMNLYPLGKKSVSKWPIAYNNLFLFKCYDDYLKKVKNERFPILKEYWKEKSPQVTICFGITFLEDFKYVFDLNGSMEIINDAAKIYYYPKQKVIITPFFDNRNMGRDKINLVKEILANFKYQS